MKSRGREGEKEQEKPVDTCVVDLMLVLFILASLLEVQATEKS